MLTESTGTVKTGQHLAITREMIYLTPVFLEKNVEVFVRGHQDAHTSHGQLGMEELVG